MPTESSTQDAQTEHPCRLFCLLARQAPVGLIVRRGPGTWVQLSLWHTDTDEIEYGQWFHGRLLEDRCDLSPDGSLFIYFASKYGRSPFETWTAISRPPYFTALALWPLGHSWGGGGLFVDEKTVLLNFSPNEAPAPCGQEPPRWLKVSMYTGGLGEIFSERLLRDGWTRLQKGIQSPNHRSLKLLEPEIFQKRSPDSEQVLLRKCLGYDSKRYGSPMIYEFSLKDSTHSQERLLEGVTWADLDHRQRLVLTKNDGCLYASEIQHDGFSPQLLANLNGQRPESVSTPEWATTWEKLGSRG
jgi:hypothetical protein